MSNTLSIEEGNRLIVEFMGAKKNHANIGHVYTFDVPPTKNASYQWDYFAMKYHSSWDWLKPVIDKIFTYSLAYRDEVIKIRNMSIVVDIQPAWEHCVKFIQFLNSTKKP